MSKAALSEETVKLVLLRNKGDLIRSSSEMNVRPSTLVAWIRSVPSVSTLFSEMEALKADSSFEAATQQQFETEIRARLQTYRLDGVEVLHELATRDDEGVSAMAEVRLKAAIQLAGASQPQNSMAGNVLSELNELYRLNAPRIKSMRAIQIEFDDPITQPVEQASLTVSG